MTFKSEKEIFVCQLRLFLVAAAAVAALAVPGAVDAGGTVTQPLIATVGTKASPEDPVISLTDSTGAKVTHLDTGAYTITGHDFATTHSFHLLGPGVDKATGVETTGDTSWNVVVIDGTYRYFCDAHPTTMRGSFTAGLVTTPPPPGRARQATKGRALQHQGEGSDQGGQLPPRRAGRQPANRR